MGVTVFTKTKILSMLFKAFFRFDREDLCWILGTLLNCFLFFFDWGTIRQFPVGPFQGATSDQHLTQHTPTQPRHDTTQPHHNSDNTKPPQHNTTTTLCHNKPCNTVKRYCFEGNSSQETKTYCCPYCQPDKKPSPTSQVPSRDTATNL